MAMTGDQDSESGLTELQAAEIDRRLAAYAAPPGNVVPWEVVKAEALNRVSRTRLARECAKLDPLAEREFADEGLARDLEVWPEY